MEAATLTKLARETAERRVGKDMVRDVNVSDYMDAAGEPAFDVLIVISKFDPDVLSSAVRHEIGRALYRALTENGDQRYPFVRFVPEDELAETAANDD